MKSTIMKQEEVVSKMNVLVPELNKDEVAKLKQEFETSLREKTEMRIKEKVEDFEKKISDRHGRDREILAKKITLRNIKVERQALLGQYKKLKSELKELSPRKARKVKDVTESSGRRLSDKHTATA